MKRGIIHLCKIGILFKNRDFEHDVYELIKAFYPEAEIHTLYEKDVYKRQVLGPCINASGRLDTAARSLALLNAKTKEEAARLAGDLTACLLYTSRCV